MDRKHVQEDCGQTTSSSVRRTGYTDGYSELAYKIIYFAKRDYFERRSTPRFKSAVCFFNSDWAEFLVEMLGSNHELVCATIAKQRSDFYRIIAEEKFEEARLWWRAHMGSFRCPIPLNGSSPKE